MMNYKMIHKCLLLNSDYKILIFSTFSNINILSTHDGSKPDNYSLSFIRTQLAKMFIVFINIFFSRFCKHKILSPFPHFSSCLRWLFTESIDFRHYSLGFTCYSLYAIFTKTIRPCFTSTTAWKFMRGKTNFCH